MSIDFKQMASVELATSIQNYLVKYYDEKKREMEAWVERTFIENDPSSEDFEVTYTTANGEEITLPDKERAEVIALVKHFIAGTIEVEAEK